MISFDLSSEQQLLVDTVTKFASNELRKAARAADEDAQLPRPLIETGWTLGLVPSNLPEAYGGFGNPSALNGVLAAEALAYGDLSAALHILAPALAAYPVALCGTEEQKQTYLPLFAGDQFFPATAAFVEPSVQFDAHNMLTTAACQGDAYVLNGHKCLVPLAAEAELLLVYAAEAGATQAFIVERDTPGVSIGPREGNLGLRALATHEISLTNVRVPNANRLGGDNGCDFQQLLN